MVGGHGFYFVIFTQFFFSFLKTMSHPRARGKFYHLSKHLHLNTTVSRHEQLSQCREQLYSTMLSVAVASTHLHQCRSFAPYMLDLQLKLLVQRLNGSERVREWAFLYNELVTQTKSNGESMVGNVRKKK